VASILRATVTMKLDIGGGLTTMDTPHALSNISLRWMVRQIVQSKCGIQLDEEALKRLHIPLGDLSEGDLQAAEAREAQDAVAPLHNAFRRVPFWWILELFPGTYVWQDANGAWRKTWG